MRINPVVLTGGGRTDLCLCKGFTSTKVGLENNNSKQNIQDINIQHFYKPLNVNQKHKNGYSFTGVTQYIPRIEMNCADDLIRQWEYLSKAIYLEALDDFKFPQNKTIRKLNYSFLDNVPQAWKKTFIDYFKEFTGFPDLEKTSKRIEKEYVQSVKNACPYGVSPILAGYDPTCSIGLEKALPGSDVDKAYVILKNNTYRQDWDVVNKFKANLWFNTDQRILSLNNEDTFPEVYTTKQVYEYLDKLDTIFEDSNINRYIGMGYCNYFPKVIDSVKAAKFNIHFAQYLPRLGISKEFAKNFAYFIEPVQHGKVLIETDEFVPLAKRIKSSDFALHSNVTQMKVENMILKFGLKDIKTKLKYRKELIDKFDDMPIETQFDLIKDIIKSVSKDNDNPKFSKYFENDDNIKERFDRLNHLLIS